MGLEFELKYKATPALQDELARLSQHWQTIAMETTYYDTPSLALSAKKYTLRRRLENGVSICTVKTPAGDNGRGEWETEAENIIDAIPVLCKLGAPEELTFLTAQGLIPLCGARFTRRAAQVKQGDTVLEIALDSGVLFSGSRELPLCEIEVELKSGSRLDALAFGAVLERCYGLQAEPHSKFRRALSLYEEEKNHGTA